MLISFQRDYSSNKLCRNTLTNRIVEHKHKHLLELCTALLFQSHLSTSYWGECLLTATFLINKHPTRLLNYKIPSEIIFRKPPDYSFLRCFGCLCYAYTLSQNRGKLDPREVACAFIVYSFGKKGYKLFSISTRHIFVSRDVVFHEFVYCFAYLSNSAIPMFPTSPLTHFSHNDFPNSIPISPLITPLHVPYESPSTSSPILPDPTPDSPHISST